MASFPHAPTPVFEHWYLGILPFTRNTGSECAYTHLPIEVIEDWSVVANLSRHHEVCAFSTQMMDKALACIKAAGGTIDDDSFFTFDEWCTSVGEDTGISLYDQGIDGTARLDPPTKPMTPEEVFMWIADIASFVLGIEEMSRKFES